MTEHEIDAENDPHVVAQLGRLQGIALMAGLAGAALCALAALVSPSGFYPAYLVAYLFWVGIAVGSLAVNMLHHLVGGQWGFVIRRPVEAGAMTLPLMALLFLPLLAGMHTLYPWTDLKLVEADEVLRHKAPYLNVGFFLGRAAGYFAIWVALALLMSLASRKQDQVEDEGPTRLRQTISGPGLGIWFLAVTFAMIDWAMSIEPHWFSTIYPVMLLIGMILASLATMVVVASRLAQAAPWARVATPEGFHDLGNLMLAFTMLWAYMSFSQYLIIWIGNLTEEIPWYLRRSEGGWWYVAAGLITGHFFLPFFLLLFRERKRSPQALAKVALVLLTMHFIDLVWLILPAFPVSNVLAFWSVVPAWFGIGGLWLWVFAGQLKGRPLLPRNDPLLAEVFAHHAHEGEH